MAKSIAEKLRIKENYGLRTINAPKEFLQVKKEMPAGVKISATQNPWHQLHWFVLNKAQLEKELGKVLKLVKDDSTCWIYYPKGSSKIQTDLTRDKGWDKLLKEKDLQWISLISFDDTWSVFGFRRKNALDKKKAALPKQEREIFNWVNPATKEVKLPHDLAVVLRKNKKEAAFFETLSFTNKKEYIEWIVTAKKKETRTERIRGTIERLDRQWKNPRNL